MSADALERLRAHMALTGTQFSVHWGPRVGYWVGALNFPAIWSEPGETLDSLVNRVIASKPHRMPCATPEEVCRVG